MPFKTLFLAYAPDANPHIHKCFIQTPKLYNFYAVIVKNFNQALEIAQNYYENEGINSIILCPGFTHSEVAKLFELFDGKISVTVARGDGPSSNIAKKVMEQEGWFSYK